MDKNKLTILRRIGYTIPKSCGLCIHSTFSTPSSPFGTCEVYNYKHEKHIGTERDLTIYRHGFCEESFSPDSSLSELGEWREFLDRREFTRANRHKAKTQY